MNPTTKFFGALKINDKEAKEIKNNFKKRREDIETECSQKIKNIRCLF